MAASYNLAQSNGAGNTVTEINYTGGNDINFKNVDDATASNYATNPITASDAANAGNSFEVWIREHFQGTFNSVSNLKFWRSVAFSPATGLTDLYGVTTSYGTPVKTTSSVATVSLPTSVPGSANISIGGSLGGSLSAPGYSDYLVLQLHIGTTAASGDTSLATYTFQYDET